MAKFNVVTICNIHACFILIVQVVRSGTLVVKQNLSLKVAMAHMLTIISKTYIKIAFINELTF